MNLLLIFIDFTAIFLKKMSQIMISTRNHEKIFFFQISLRQFYKEMGKVTGSATVFYGCERCSRNMKNQCYKFSKISWFRWEMSRISHLGL